MKINQITKRYGITRKAILYYEEQGLIYADRLENNYRDFDQLAVEQLISINQLRLLDVPVSVIKANIQSQNSQVLLDYLASATEEVDNQQRRLRQLENYISDSKPNTELLAIDYLIANIPEQLGKYMANQYKYFLDKDKVRYYGNEKIFNQIAEYVDNHDFSNIEILLKDWKTPDYPVDFPDLQYKFVSSLKSQPEVDNQLLDVVQAAVDPVKCELSKLEFYTTFVALIRKLSPSYNLMIEKIELLEQKSEN